MDRKKIFDTNLQVYRDRPVFGCHITVLLLQKQTNKEKQIITIPFSGKCIQIQLNIHIECNF